MLYHKIDPETGLLDLNEPDVILDKPPYKTETVMQDNWMIVPEYDEEGNLIAENPVNNPVEVEQVVTDENGNPVLQDEYVDVSVSQGFYHPRWDGGEWVEGGTAPESVEQPPSEAERLKALEAAMLELVIGGAV